MIGFVLLVGFHLFTLGARAASRYSCTTAKAPDRKESPCL